MATYLEGGGSGGYSSTAKKAENPVMGFAVNLSGLYRYRCEVDGDGAFDSGEKSRSGWAFLVFEEVGDPSAMKVTVHGVRFTEERDGKVRELKTPVQWSGSGTVGSEGDHLAMNYKIQRPGKEGRTEDRFILGQSCDSTDLKGIFRHVFGDGHTITGSVNYTRVTQAQELEQIVGDSPVKIREVLSDNEVAYLGNRLAMKHKESVSPKDGDDYLLVDIVLGNMEYCSTANRFDVVRKKLSYPGAIVFAKRTDGELTRIR